MIYGYARCSTNETKQNIDRQINELKAAGCESVFFDWEHGDAAVKPQLELLLDSVEEGDTIMVLEVSRISRSVQQLCSLIDTVKEKKICLKILNSITVDCRNGTMDPVSRSFIQMAGVFSELELNIIRERVKSGMRAAASRGARIGRPPLTVDDIPQAFYKHYPSYINGTMNLSELARITNLSTHFFWLFSFKINCRQQKADAFVLIINSVYYLYYFFVTNVIKVLFNHFYCF